MRYLASKTRIENLTILGIPRSCINLWADSESPTQVCSGTALRRMFPILFFSNTLRSVPLWDKNFRAKCLSPSSNVLFELPNSFDPWFSELGRVTSLISCSTFDHRNFSVGETENTKHIAGVLLRDRRQLYDTVRSSSHFLHLPDLLKSKHRKQSVSSSWEIFVSPSSSTSNTNHVFPSRKLTSSTSNTVRWFFFWKPACWFDVGNIHRCLTNEVKISFESVRDEKLRSARLTLVSLLLDGLESFESFAGDSSFGIASALGETMRNSS